MARILTITVGVTSHLYSHLTLAHRLRPTGHDFVIASHDRRIRGEVEAAGLQFEHLKSPYGAWQPSPYAPGLRGWLDGGAYAARRRKIVLAGAGLPEALAEHDPDLILVDSELHEFVVLSLCAGRPTATIDFHLSVIRRDNIPRLSEFRVPADTLTSRLLSEYGWRSTAVKQALARWLRKVSTRRNDKHSVLRELADSAGLDFDSLVDTGHWQHYTFPALPCLRATVPELDFGSWPPASNEYYVGPLILGSEHRPYDDDVSSLAADFLDAQPPSSPVVLMSLGSMLDAPDPVLTAIRAVTGKPVSLLVSSGRADIDIPADDMPSNVLLTPWLPFKALLPAAQLVISHGGVATIHECIDAGVPMLLYSQGIMDMNGNAARVHGKGMGVAGKSGDSPDAMWERIEMLLSDQRYRDRCLEMREQFARYGGSERLASVIGSVMSDAGTTRQ